MSGSTLTELQQQQLESEAQGDVEGMGLVREVPCSRSLFSRGPLPQVGAWQ